MKHLSRVLAGLLVAMPLSLAICSEANAAPLGSDRRALKIPVVEGMTDDMWKNVA